MTDPLEMATMTTIAEARVQPTKVITLEDDVVTDLPIAESTMKTVLQKKGQGDLGTSPNLRERHSRGAQPLRGPPDMQRVTRILQPPSYQTVTGKDVERAIERGEQEEQWKETYKGKEVPRPTKVPPLTSGNETQNKEVAIPNIQPSTQTATPVPPPRRNEGE